MMEIEEQEVTFTMRLPEGAMSTTGICVVEYMDRDGKPFVATGQLSDTTQMNRIGLLQMALDNFRMQSLQTWRYGSGR